MLCCILALLSGCKDGDDNPPCLYNGEYEVPMDGRRYLDLESGNGSYSFTVKDIRIASAGTETGWSGVPVGHMIHVTDILTGAAYLITANNATQETYALPIKAVDSYENMELLRSYLFNLPNGDANLLPNTSDISLINNHARDAYSFKQGEQTAFSSGLELITQGNYRLKEGEGDGKKMTLTLTFPEDMAAPVSDHKFIIWGNSYLFHRSDKSLNLNWDIPPIGETRTSPAPPPSYTLEEIAEGTGIGKGR